MPSDRELIELGAKMQAQERQGIYNASPMSPQKDWEVAKGVGNVLYQSALPTLGAIGGSVAGGAMGGFPGMVAGEAVGSMGGEALNQQLGITKPDTNQILLAGGIPPLMRGLWGAGRASLMRLPGAAIEAQAQGLAAARDIPNKLRITVRVDPATGQPYHADDLYQRVQALEQQNQLMGIGPIVIGTKHQRAAAQELKDKIQLIQNPENQDPSVLALADGVLNRSMTGVMTMQEWDATRRAYGIASKYTGKERTKELQSANARMYEAMYRDIDERIAAASADPLKAHIEPETLQTLKDAIAMHRIDKTADTVAQHIEDHFVHIQPGSGLKYIQGKSLRTYLKKEPWIKTLPKDQQRDIENTADMIAAIPGLPPPAQVQFGAGRVLGRSAGAAGVAQYATGDPNVAALAGGLVAAAPQVIGYALSTAPGRALLRGIMKTTKGTITPQALSILGAFATATQAQPMQAPAPMAQPLQGLQP